MDLKNYHRSPVIPNKMNYISLIAIAKIAVIWYVKNVAPESHIRNLVKRKNYIIIGIFAFISLSLVVWYFVILDILSNMGNPNGVKAPDYPYFITTERVIVKKIMLPKETKLTYEEHFFREGQQDRMMSEQKLSTIELPRGETIDWGGVPVYMIVKFFNSEMKGFSVYADFSILSDDKKTKFSEIWQSCDSDLGVLIKNTDDWTFNAKNIDDDIEDCGVNYQRYFKEDAHQRKVLDKLYIELKKVDADQVK